MSLGALLLTFLVGAVIIGWVGKIILDYWY